jgi:beta-lactam-binding protein with PASTA domain
VPNVLGQRLQAARARIRARRCRVGNIRYVRTRRRLINRVVGQNPRGGAIRPVGFRVNLRVGRR